MLDQSGREANYLSTRIVQAMQDGFNHKPMKWSALALLDLNKAYDTVMRCKLRHTLLDEGLPMGITKFLRHFLTNRQARAGT